MQKPPVELLPQHRGKVDSLRPVGSTKGDVELAWGALAAREAGGLPIHPPPQSSELGWSSSGPGTLRNWDLRRSYTHPALTELNVRLTPTETLVQRWVGKKNMHSRIFPVRALWWGRMLGIQSRQVWFRGRMHGRLPGGGDVYTATQRTERDLAWSGQKVLNRWIKSVKKSFSKSFWASTEAGFWPCLDLEQVKTLWVFGKLLSIDTWHRPSVAVILKSILC